MICFIGNIEDIAEENESFRTVLFTTEHTQLVVMSLKPGEDIGMETHDNVDQFIRIEDGQGKAILGGQEYEIEDDYAILIPAGTEHNIVNTGDGDLKLYSLYSPPEHPAETEHKTKADAEKAEKQE